MEVWVRRKEDFECGSGKATRSEFLGKLLLLVVPLVRVECKEKVGVEEEAQSIAIVALAVALSAGELLLWNVDKTPSCPFVNSEMRKGKTVGMDKFAKHNFSSTLPLFFFLTNYFGKNMFFTLIGNLETYPTLQYNKIN